MCDLLSLFKTSKLWRSFFQAVEVVSLALSFCYPVGTSIVLASKKLGEEILWNRWRYWLICWLSKLSSSYIPQLLTWSQSRLHSQSIEIAYRSSREHKTSWKLPCGRLNRFRRAYISSRKEDIHCRWKSKLTVRLMNFFEEKWQEVQLVSAKSNQSPKRRCTCLNQVCQSHSR
jgi:hypothetical protein